MFFSITMWTRCTILVSFLCRILETFLPPVTPCILHYFLNIHMSVYCCPWSRLFWFLLPLFPRNLYLFPLPCNRSFFLWPCEYLNDHIRLRCFLNLPLAIIACMVFPWNVLKQQEGFVLISSPCFIRLTCISQLYNTEEGYTLALF